MSKPFKSRHSWASNKKNSNNALSKVKALFANISMLENFDKNRLGKNLLLLGVAAFLIGTIMFLGLFAWISRDLPDPNSLSTREVAQSTKIYDRTGEHLLYEISGDEKRTLVGIEQIPDYVVKATIIAEDRKFYDHGGIDFKGIARAVFSNVTSFDPTGQGASTITQQLVKNAILTNERTYTRKIKEIVLSLALERRYTKDEIMQLYLNEIPYGSTNYGVESASHAYFEKNVEDLSIAEAATIAALPNAPSTFLNNPEKLLLRRDWILDNMEEAGYISKEELETALAEKTHVDLKLTQIDAPHFVLWVKEQLETEYGERLVEQGGLIVTTTLDFDKQTIAEEAVNNTVESLSEAKGFNNQGLVALDPKNGHILAMVGSADYFNDEIDGQVNVTLRPLQPGSSMKPIIYTAGFEKGYTPNSILYDVETDFPTATGNYHPRNYDLGEKGPVSIRKAIQGSLNIPAVKMLYLIGVEAGLDFAQRMGYTTFEDRSRFGLAVVLGGGEVKLLEHTAAYATFANDGVYHAPISILKVEKPNGEILHEWEEDEGNKVIEPNIARTITNVLSDNGARAYAFGLNSVLTLPGRPVAAKTGTTNNYKDGWTMGYTPSLVAGVWAGNTNGAEMNRGSGGSTAAGPTWNEFMRRALEGTGVEGFTAPQIAQTGKNILDGEVPTATIVIDTVTGKLATDMTPERFREKKVCGEYHTILTYVDRFNPLGDVPSNPEKDPMFTKWETAIQEWLVRENEKAAEGDEPQIEICEVPTEEDDIHTQANQPSLKVIQPKNNNRVGRQVAVTISTSAPRGISRIEYLIDGSFVKLDTNRSGTVINLPSWVSVGRHILTIKTFDDVDNSTSQDVRIDVTDPGQTGGFSITNPFNNQTIEKVNETYSIVLESSQASNYKSVSLRAQNLWTGELSIIKETSSPGGLTTVTWTLPAEAEYLLSAQAVTLTGQTVDAAPVKIFVKDLDVPEPPLEEPTE